MSNTDKIFEEVKGLYKIIPLKPFRRTPGVFFDIVPCDILLRIDGIDRVIHNGGAISPGQVGAVERVPRSMVRPETMRCSTRC